MREIKIILLVSVHLYIIGLSPPRLTFHFPVWPHRPQFMQSLGKGQGIVICMPSTFYKQWTYRSLKINYISIQQIRFMNRLPHSG